LERDTQNSGAGLLFNLSGMSASLQNNHSTACWWVFDNGPHILLDAVLLEVMIAYNNEGLQTPQVNSPRN